jgi:hypothetical protein
LDKYLSSEELELYLSMVGEGGWCIHFDHNTRECKIYEQRPRFCRVKPDIFQQMYDIDATEFNDFAIDCCRQQIEGVYGRNSQEMRRYNQDGQWGIAPQPTLVPTSPARILAPSSSRPIPAKPPVVSTNRQAASTFGPIEPGAKL